METQIKTGRTPEIIKIAQATWENAGGKIILCCLMVLAALFLISPALKLGARTVHSYKDFRDACNR